MEIKILTKIEEADFVWGEAIKNNYSTNRITNQMKKFLQFLIISIISINTYSQIVFEKGYFINNAGQKTDCFIQNIDWNSNPSKFKYELKENTETKEASIITVKEFGIYGTSRYLRANVKIDRSSDLVNEMSDKRQVEFRDEQLFLNVLIEGKSNLFLYQDKNLIRFFYSVKNGEIKQLIYKKYKKGNNYISENNHYQQQLFNNLNCQKFKIDQFKRIAYSQNDLLKYFIENNNCETSDIINYVNKKSKKKIFNITIRPGINNATLSIISGNHNYDIDFSNETGFRIGVELESFLSFNKNKWSIVAEPSFQKYNSKVEVKFEGVASLLYFEANYITFEIPLGLRYYMFVNDNNKFFVNALVVAAFSIDSSISQVMNYTNEQKLIPYAEVNSITANMAFGFGYNYKSKYSLEVRYGFNRNILEGYEDFGSKFNTLSVNLGYTIF